MLQKPRRRGVPGKRGILGLVDEYWKNKPARTPRAEIDKFHRKWRGLHGVECEIRGLWTTRQMQPRLLRRVLGDHLAAAHDLQPRRPQADRLDRVARLQNDEVGVAAGLEPVAIEAHQLRG